jgi:nucleoside-diphosphate-sugar epimerase
MRVAVTGGAGHVGRYLVPHLSERHEVVVLDRRDPPEGPWRTVRGDLSDAAAVGRALAGADAVCHLAAVPRPDLGSPDEILRTNVLGTLRIYEGAVRAGVGRMALASSESVLGFAFASAAGEGEGPRPERFPVDEEHPLRPRDAYGLSKLLAERLGQDFAARGVETVALRAPWVWTPEEADLQRDLVTDPGRWSHGLWAYVEAQDLCEAFERALTASVPGGFAAVYVAAEDAGVAVPVRELAARFFPETPVSPDLRPDESLIRTTRARELLGWQPRRRWRDRFPDLAGSPSRGSAGSPSRGSAGSPSRGSAGSPSRGDPGAPASARRRERS